MKLNKDQKNALPALCKARGLEHGLKAVENIVESLPENVTKASQKIALQDASKGIKRKNTKIAYHRARADKLNDRLTKADAALFPFAELVEQLRGRPLTDEVITLGNVRILVADIWAAVQARELIASPLNERKPAPEVAAAAE